MAITTCGYWLTKPTVLFNSVHMFTETLTNRFRDRVLRSPLLDLLTGPHGVDRYTEIVDPVWIKGNARAKVVAVRRQTPRSVTLTLEPNRAVVAASCPLTRGLSAAVAVVAPAAGEEAPG